MKSTMSICWTCHSQIVFLIQFVYLKAARSTRNNRHQRRKQQKIRCQDKEQKEFRFQFPFDKIRRMDKRFLIARHAPTDVTGTLRSLAAVKAWTWMIAAHLNKTSSIKCTEPQNNSNDATRQWVRVRLNHGGLYYRSYNADLHDWTHTRRPGDEYQTIAKCRAGQGRADLITIIYGLQQRARCWLMVDARMLI